MTRGTIALALLGLSLAGVAATLTWRDWPAPLHDARRVPCALYEDSDRGELIARGTLEPGGVCRVPNSIPLAYMDTQGMPIRLCWLHPVDGLHCQRGLIGHPVELTPLDE